MCIQINECMYKILISYLQYKVKFIYMIFPVLGLLSPPSPGDLPHHQTHTNTPTVNLHPKHLCMTLNTKTKTHIESYNTVYEYIWTLYTLRERFYYQSCTSHTPEYFIVISFKLNKVFRVFRHDFKDHFARD